MLKLMKNKMPTLIAYTLSSRTRQTLKPKLAKEYAIVHPVSPQGFGDLPTHKKTK